MEKCQEGPNLGRTKNLAPKKPNSFTNKLKDEETDLTNKMNVLEEKHFKEILSLSSCINKLKDKLDQEKGKSVPFELFMNKDVILTSHKNIDQEDLKFFYYIIDIMRNNRKDFNSEKDRRLDYFIKKYTKPTLVPTTNEEGEEDANDPNRIFKKNRILLNYNYIVSEVAQMINKENDGLEAQNEKLRIKISNGNESETLLEN